jgi:hypothetical protein
MRKGLAIPSSKAPLERRAPGPGSPWCPNRVGAWCGRLGVDVATDGPEAEKCRSHAQRLLADATSAAISWKASMVCWICSRVL